MNGLADSCDVGNGFGNVSIIGVVSTDLYDDMTGNLNSVAETKLGFSLKRKPLDELAFLMDTSD
jgi:hypothetical protein